MKRRVWIEIRYGNPKEHNILVCRTEDKKALRAVKRKLLNDALGLANLWQEVDEIQATEFWGSYRKLKSTLGLLIPDEVESGEESNEQ
jgi:hypothetical protein